LPKAVQHLQAGRLEEAKSLYLQILAADVRHAPSLFGLGLIAQQSGGVEVAEKMFRRAIAADPEKTEYRFQLGVVLQASGRHDEALSVFRDVLHIDPQDVLAHFRVGNILQLDGRLDEAVLKYERILELKSDAHDAQFNIGNVFRLQGKLTEARESYLRALAIQPGNVDSLWNLSLLDLLEGDYASGWPRYETRHGRPTPNLRGFSEPQWKGEPLNGARILLHAEQGLGDTLQFLRYVPMVAAAGGQVLLDVPETLRRLAAEVSGVSSVTATGDPIPTFEWHCPMMSLPLAFQTKVDSIPADVPYLRVPVAAQKSAEKLAWPDRGLRVGLIWGATRRPFEDSDRSIPLLALESIFTLKGAHFYSLQVGPAAPQLESLQTPVTDLRDRIRDFADTAALVSHLDLVITVDTSVEHVAGALAKPTWILLPFASDWRWLTDREDSPWYPTARLFRQPRPGDWQSVIERVRGELVHLEEKAGR
jgi:Tfp pilus assembly protein PilF